MHYGRAGETKDVRMCEIIGKVGLSVDNCFRIIGVEKMDIQICKKIIEQNTRDRCELVVNNRIKYCNEGRDDSYCQ